MIVYAKIIRRGCQSLPFVYSLLDYSTPSMLSFSALSLFKPCYTHAIARKEIQTFSLSLIPPSTSLVLFSLEKEKSTPANNLRLGKVPSVNTAYRIHERKKKNIFTMMKKKRRKGERQ